MDQTNNPRPKPDEKLFVTVTGGPNSGKTTVSRIIERALKKAGFEVSNIDADAANREKGLFPIEEDRVRRFAEGHKITVLSAQVQRRALVKPAP